MTAPRAWYRRPAVWSGVGAGLVSIAGAFGVVFPDWLAALWRVAASAFAGG